MGCHVEFALTIHRCSSVLRPREDSPIATFSLLLAITVVIASQSRGRVPRTWRLPDAGRHRKAHAAGKRRRHGLGPNSTPARRPRAGHSRPTPRARCAPTSPSTQPAHRNGGRRRAPGIADVATRRARHRRRQIHDWQTPPRRAEGALSGRRRRRGRPRTARERPGGTAPMLRNRAALAATQTSGVRRKTFGAPLAGAAVPISCRPRAGAGTTGIEFPRRRRRTPLSAPADPGFPPPGSRRFRRPGGTPPIWGG